MSEFDPEAMDAAANEAENELNDLPDEVVNLMAKWWYRNFMKAGHKRLGRILVGIAKDLPKEDYNEQKQEV